MSVARASPGKAHGTAPARDARWALRQIDHVFPGTSAAYTGRAYEDHWAHDPWVHGAYSYYRVGQAANYGELAAASDGRFLFAGEHTSIDNIGFLDGAVETGERAARQLFRRVGALSRSTQTLGLRFHNPAPEGCGCARGLPR